MAKAINDDICIQGSTLIIGIKFPPIDDTYSLTTLLNAGNLTVKYYIINIEQKYTVSTLYTIDNVTDDNSRAFTVSNTANLTPGVPMVETIAQVLAHNGLPARTEIARCSTSIAIIK